MTFWFSKNYFYICRHQALTIEFKFTYSSSILWYMPNFHNFLPTHHALCHKPRESGDQKSERRVENSIKNSEREAKRKRYKFVLWSLSRVLLAFSSGPGSSVGRLRNSNATRKPLSFLMLTIPIYKWDMKGIQIYISYQLREQSSPS